MNSPLGRALLTVAALILIGSSYLHATAYKTVSAAVTASGLSPVFANAYRALWVADSTTGVTVGLVAGMLAFRPALATRLIVAVLALVPAAIAACVYYFLGAFPPGHLMIAAAALMALAAALPPRKAP